MAPFALDRGVDQGGCPYQRLAALAWIITGICVVPSNSRRRMSRMQIPTLPSWMFELLAGPAHVWLWVCAKLCGGTFTHGPGDDHVAPVRPED